MTDTFSVENTSDGLLVRNYPVVGFMKAGEHAQVKIDLDAAYFDGQKALFDILKAENKLPRFGASHAPAADVWGRVVEYHRAGEMNNLDILITNPEAQAKFNRGEIPSLSAELIPNADFPLLWAVAATGKDQAQFDIGKPDFMPKELTDRLAKLGKKVETIIAAPAQLAFKPAEKKADKTGGDPKSAGAKKVELPKVGENDGGSERMKPDEGRTSPEEVLSAQNKVIGEMLSRIDNLEKERQDALASETPDGEEPVDPNAEDQTGMKPDMGQKPDMGMKGKAMAEDKKPAQFDASVELAKMSRELKIRDMADEVKEAGCPLKVSEIKAKLAAMKSDAEMETEKAKLASMPARMDDTDGVAPTKPADSKGMIDKAKAYFEKYAKSARAAEQGRYHALAKMKLEDPALHAAYTAHLVAMTPMVSA